MSLNFNSPLTGVLTFRLAFIVNHRHRMCTHLEWNTILPHSPRVNSICTFTLIFLHGLDQFRVSPDGIRQDSTGVSVHSFDSQTLRIDQEECVHSIPFSRQWPRVSSSRDYFRSRIHYKATSTRVQHEIQPHQNENPNRRHFATIYSNGMELSVSGAWAL